MNNKYKYSNIAFMLYIFAAAAALLLFVVSFNLEGEENIPENFSDCWYTDSELTVKADTENPPLEDMRCTFYSSVPDTVKPGDCLWFKSKNAFITVKVGSEQRAEISAGNAAFLYGKAPGTDWVCVPLERADASKIISVDFTACYDDGSSYIDSFSIGSTLGSVRFTMSDRIFGTVVCIMLILVGAGLVIGNLVLLRYVKDMTRDFLYLGLTTIFAALWSLSELRVMQVFTDKNAGIFHNLSCMCLMLIVLPLVYYYRSVLDGKSKYIVPAVSTASLINFIVSVELHFSGRADFHQTLTFTHIMIGLGAACVIYANYLIIFKNSNKTFTEILPAICMVLFAAAAIVDVIRYKIGAINDSAFFTRITLGVYVLSLGIRSLLYITQMMRKGMKADIISRLAYEDGLTGLGNRTAYSEKIEEIKGQKTTIFVFDINNLKYVNDNIGHLAGDELIKAGADMIQAVFGKAGNCYRTGGDEFVCLAKGALDTERYSEEFYGNIRAFNQKGVLGFPLIIAMGCEVYGGSGEISAAVDAADRNMYINKAELKKSENGMYARK